ncbi:MAG TPA: NAD(P)/FAD-dependent oxidoreductase [Candidatus Baltobacteraceae bacterium]|nr:NAD(P)/FAD-dependent oxidoreductase [Candidatus Baltobacteraceae bacterium]
MTELRTEVAIIGAGASGLAAARHLHERGVDYLLIEARERVGGRAYTLRSHDGSLPVELGAEFIHGRPKSTLALLQESGEAEMGEEFRAFQRRDGRLEEAPDVWETIERVLTRVDVRGRDQSVEAFLDTIAREELSDDQRDAVRYLIEGFDAAITSDASAIAIAKEWRSGINDTSTRAVNGYGRLMRHLARSVTDRTLLQTRVDDVRWSAQGVHINASRPGGRTHIEARRAIVTLPIGVLHAEPKLFDPILPGDKRTAIAAIAMGPVIKVMLDFRSRFWETVEGGRYRDAGFFQAPGCPLRTLWTRLPERTTLLSAWAGGGAALRLIERRIDPIDAALETAQTLFPSVDVRAELRSAYYHDWQADPFARGAYTFLRVGGGEARASLGAPVGETLYFAGEATSVNDSGTVAGALDSGHSSALKITK